MRQVSAPSSSAATNRGHQVVPESLDCSSAGCSSDTVLALVGPGPRVSGSRLDASGGAGGVGSSLARSSRCCAHKGRNYAAQHRTQRLDSALVCERRCLFRVPCVRTSRQKGTGKALTARPHEAPPQHRLGTWVEDHDLLLWSKVVNAPDGAGCSLTRPRRPRAVPRMGRVLMHLMVLGAP